MDTQEHKSFDEPTFPDEKPIRPSRSSADISAPYSHQAPKQSLITSRTALLAAGAILLVIASFFGGVQYEKSHTDSTGRLATQASSNSAVGGGFSRGNGGRMGARAGGVGTVTAVSSDSITIAERSFGGPDNSSGSTDTTAKTYSITSSTAITVNGSTGTASDIQSGDTVFIRTASSTSTVAISISDGEMTGAPDSSQQSTTDTTDSSTTDSTTSTI